MWRSKIYLEHVIQHMNSINLTCARKGRLPYLVLYPVQVLGMLLRYHREAEASQWVVAKSEQTGAASGCSTLLWRQDLDLA